MILQSLVNLYEKLAEQGKLPRSGWAPVQVSYVINLNDDGSIADILYIETEETVGKKTVMKPRSLELPQPAKRSSGIAANFLCDNSTYILGIDGKGKPKRSAECFEAAGKLHHTVLDGVESPTARAILNFFDSWIPDAEDPRISDYLDDFYSGKNITFQYKGNLAAKDPLVAEAWQSYIAAQGEGSVGRCMLTGTEAPITTLHPSIKGVPGAQSSGASLVSFHADAFCSYNKEQGMNAPVSQYAANAYGLALNYLVSTQRRRIGDTTVLFWAESAEEAYQDIFDSFVFGEESSKYKEADLSALLDNILAGKPVPETNIEIEPNMDFYVLGISPNAARLSVRFFLRNSFGSFLKNVREHQRRLEIVRPSFDNFDYIPLWKLLSETVNQKSKDKSPVPNLAGETMRAILCGTKYPSNLLTGVELRIRADREVNRTRAAIIKAFYLNNTNKDVPKEVLHMALNTESTNVAYNLGRLFAVLENIQNCANPGINTTIRDKYFSSASATPAVVFPTLINLAQKHLKKIDIDMKVKLDRQLTELLGKLGTEYPAHLSLPQQGAFQLGYYHQTADRYTKKEDK